MGGGGGRSAMGMKMLRLKLVPVRLVAVPAMSPGCDRRELNGDQKDRRPDHPQNCSDRSHVHCYHTVRARGTTDEIAVNAWSPLVNDRSGR